MTGKTLELVVGESSSKQRLDAFIAQKSDLSRSRSQQLIDDECVFIDDKLTTKSSTRVKEFQRIVIRIPVLVESAIEAEDIDLAIAYEDKDLIVINKPNNMVVHPAPGHYSGTLVNALIYHCQDLSGINGVMRPGIVHRLDKDTSGLIVIAKNDFTHVSLSAQLKHRLVSRRYWAIVHGHFKQKQGVVQTLIGRSRTNRMKMAVLNHRGKTSVTFYKTLAEFKGYSLVELKLHTGRTHQIRVHMKHLGHPVLGDELYGLAKDKEICNFGQWLHAARLSFIHPRLQKKISLKCLPPAYRLTVLDSLAAEAGIDIDINTLIES